jgi:hypothetical protein
MFGWDVKTAYFCDWIGIISVTYTVTDFFYLHSAWIAESLIVCPQNGLSAKIWNFKGHDLPKHGLFYPYFVPAGT